MSTSYDDLKKEAAAETERFKRYFRVKFGAQPIVHYNLDLPFQGKIKLDELSTICSQVLNSKLAYPEVNGIHAKKRFKIIAEHRQCFFKIAKDLGFSVSDVGRHLGYNHATVIYSAKVMTNRINNKDPYATQVFNDIVTAVQQYKDMTKYSVEDNDDIYVNYGEDIQEDR